MNNTLRILLILAIGIIAVGGLLLLTQSEAAPEPLRPDGQAELVEGAEDTPEPIAATQDPDRPSSRNPSEQTGGRTESSGPDSGADFEQGVRGRVVDTRGNPVGGAEIYLMEAIDQDIFKQVLLARQGMRYPPSARAISAPDGSFALGLEEPTGKTYELRFLTQRFADFTMPGISILAQEWYDAGDIRLEDGIVVSGTVTTAAGGLPVAGAEVSLTPTTAQGSINPAPGRERGQTALTNESGFYRFENAPEAIVSMAALREGFAKKTLLRVQIQRTKNNSVDFQLEEGSIISGRVTNAAGAPIADAKIEATAFSSKFPLKENARSATDGSFTIRGLSEGPYQLVASAAGYKQQQVRAVQAGQTDQVIVLSQLSSARLRVLHPDGRAVNRYRVTVRNSFPDNDHQLGPVIDRAEETVGPSRLKNGVFEFSNLDEGTFVFEVNTQGFAKSFSQPFTIELGAAEPVEVEVRLSSGGTIRGIVYGGDGNPLPGVTVSTMANNVDENPLTKLFGGLIVTRISRSQAVTDAQGSYSLAGLAPGQYQLKYSHPEHYDLFVKGNEVLDGQVTEVPQKQLLPGTIVRGLVRVDGTPSGQVKVIITRVVEQGQSPLSSEAITDNQGRYQVEKSLPPGTYTIYASRQNLPNPLLQMVDLKQTQRQITITAAERTRQEDFDLVTSGK